MDVLIQNKGNCLVTCMAMVFDVSTEYIETQLHQFVENTYHLQQVIDFGWTHDHYVLHLDAQAGLAKAPGHPVEDVYKKKWLPRLKYYLCNRRAIIIENTHAYAWDGKKAYDPRTGKSVKLETIKIKEVLLCIHKQN